MPFDWSSAGAGRRTVGIGIGLFDSVSGFCPREWGDTGQDGTFEIRLLEGWPGSLILGIYADEVAWPCGQLGYYGPGGFTTQREAATRVEVGDADVTGIEIRLPASPEALLPQQHGENRETLGSDHTCVLTFKTVAFRWEVSF